MAEHVKRCVRCGKVKPHALFGPSKKTQDARRSRCLQCEQEVREEKNRSIGTYILEATTHDELRLWERRNEQRSAPALDRIAEQTRLALEGRLDDAEA